MADDRYVLEFVVDDQGGLRVISQLNQGVDLFDRATRKANKGLGLFTAAMTAATAAGVLLANLISRGVSAAFRFMTDTFFKSIEASQRLSNSLIGLTSVASKFGVEADQVTDAAQNLAQNGLITVGEAATGLKNLLSAGFGLEEATRLMEGFTDAAVFNRQASLSVGQAVTSATEGIKNQNSVLVDNAGLTKNLSIIMKEAGLAVSDLASISSNAAIRQKFLGGLMQELALFAGDAEKATATYTGSVSRLGTSWQALLATLGSAVTQNPAVIGAINAIAEQVRTLRERLEEVDLAALTVEWIGSLISFGRATLSTVSLASKLWTGFKTLMGGIATIIVGTAEAFARLNAMIAEANSFLHPFSDEWDRTASRMRGAADIIGTLRQDLQQFTAANAQATMETNEFDDALAELDAILSAAEQGMRNATAAAGGTGGGAGGGGLAPAMTNVAAETKAAEEAQKGFEETIKRVTAENDAANRLYQQSAKLIAEVAETTHDWSFAIETTTPEIVKMGARLPELERNIENVRDEIDQMPSALDKVKQAFENTLDDLNRVFRAAFEGGGGVRGAIQSLATNLVQDLLSMIPVVGNVLSRFGGAIVSGFRRLFSIGGPSQEELQGRELVKDFEDGIIGTLNAMQLAEAQGERWRQVVVGVRDIYVAAGRTAEEGVAAVQRLWDAIKDGGPEAVQAAIDEIVKVQAEVGELEGLYEQLEEAQKALADATTVDFKEMQAAAEKYGIELSALGEKFNQARIDDAAVEIADDFDLLKEGGADVNKTLEGMADEVQELIDEAAEAGVAIPENMKPIIEAMIEQGLLVDENGAKLEDLSGIEFSAPLVSETDKIIDALQELVDSIKEAISQFGKLEGAAAGVPGAPPAGGAGGSGADIPEFQHGGIVTRPTLARIGEAGPEAIVPLSRGGGLGPTIHIDLTGSVIASDAARADLVRDVGDAIVQRLALRTRLTTV